MFYVDTNEINSNPIMHIYTENVFHMVNRIARNKIIFHKDSQGLLSDKKFPEWEFTLSIKMGRKNTYF